MVLDAALLNTQYIKVRIKGKVEQSWEWSNAFLHFGVVAIEKGAFGSPLTPTLLIIFYKRVFYSSWFFHTNIS